MARGTRSEAAVKDEVALKKAGKKDATGKVTSKERKVRIHDAEGQKPAKKGKKSTEIASKAKKSVADELLPSLDPNGETGTEQVAPTEIINESETKHTPKHRDGKKQPSKSVIKKSKKRKADADPEEGTEEADASAFAETSLAGQSANGEDDETNGEIDFLGGFESGSDDENEDGAENSSDDEDAVPITAKDLPQPTKGKVAKQAAGKGKAKKDAVSP